MQRLQVKDKISNCLFSFNFYLGKLISLAVRSIILSLFSAVINFLVFCRLPSTSKMYQQLPLFPCVLDAVIIVRMDLRLSFPFIPPILSLFITVMDYCNSIICFSLHISTVQIAHTSKQRNVDLVFIWRCSLHVHVRCRRLFPVLERLIDCLLRRIISASPVYGSIIPLGVSVIAYEFI